MISPEATHPRLIHLHFCALALTALPTATGCATRGPLPPAWHYTAVSFGSGQLRLSVRRRSIAIADDYGAIIRTPEGAQARVRVFACTAAAPRVRTLLRKRLGPRLVGAQIFDHGSLFAWRFLPAKRVHDQSANLPAINAAVIPHGPLLLATTSSTMPLDEVIKITQKIRIELPIPLNQGCFPLCDGAGAPCTLYVDR